MTRYGNKGKYNALRDDYKTPPEIYEPILELLEKDKFDIDVCSTEKNIPANINYTKNENGLLQQWGGLCFCNPPWKTTQKWIKKGFETLKCVEDFTVWGNDVNFTEIVYVIPSNRMETGYMQDCVVNNPHCVWLILPNKQGFIIPGCEDTPPIPSVGVAVAIMSARAKALQIQINKQNIFKTTAFVGEKITK